MADVWNSPAGRRLRMQCFVRDRDADAPCHWCGERIDYSLGPYTRGGDTMAWSPEHLRPRSMFPHLALEPTNIVAAHFRCNDRRGTKAGVTELGQRTRRW